MPRKIVLIARRDFAAAVLTKGFLFGLIAPFVLGAIGFGAVKMIGGNGVRRVAVLDHTGSGIDADLVQMARLLEEATKANPALAAVRTANFAFEAVAVDAVDPTKQRSALTDRARSGELFGILDVESLSKVVLHTSSGTGGMAFVELTEAINNGMRRAKLSRTGIDPVRFTEVLLPVEVVVKTLAAKNAKAAEEDKSEKRDLVRSIVIPVVLMVVMMFIVVAAASGMLLGVAEDKKERVFEMMLASATPLEIIAGKVLGSVGVSVTTAAAWISLAAFALYTKGMIGLAPLEVLPWFFAFLVCQITMMSALGAALGAASSTPRDAQQLNGILILPSMLPIMLFAVLLDQPNGARATAMSFFPPFTPMVMMFRQAMPGGVPAWQPWVALVGIVLWTLGTIWAASRIFRVGLLMQGKQPGVAELARWAIRG